MGKIISTSFNLFIILILFIGCSSGVVFYHSYQPNEHQTLLVLLPKGNGANIIGKVLDHLENPPFRIISLPENECLNHTETEKMYRFIQRVNIPIAIAMAKQVQATLVLFEDEEYATTPFPQHSGKPITQNFNDENQFVKQEDNQEEFAKKLRIAILDVRKETIIWHEVLSNRPSESAVIEFANRLTTPYQK